MIRRQTILAVLVTALGCAAGCQSTDKTAPVQGLYPNFGTYHRPILTESTEAQLWFDQGLQLLYGFNHDEAIRAFTMAAEADPQCPMAWWGVAYANGLHINNPAMTEAQSKAGYEAAQQALRHLNRASPVERSLVIAVSKRYAWPIPEDRTHLDETYAEAMQQAWKASPTDPDVGALYAESLMDLQPWDLWTPAGEPKGRAEEIVAVLERVMEIDPEHPGANHFYIHAVEASLQPERALPAARRLEHLVPGSGHLVHMPSHIYLRLGMYDEASDINERAIRADDAYFAIAPEPAFYGLYIAHNYHFLTYAAMMEGRYETALTAATDLEAQIPPKFLEQYTFLADGFMFTSRHVMIRFGKWNDILEQPEPPAFRKLSVAMHHYARGVALSALGRSAEARTELAAFRAAAAEVPDDWQVGNNTAQHVLSIAHAMLDGEVQYREGDYDQAFARLREGAALEDELKYDEPPGWLQPVRHALGALLMAAGRPEDAEAVYLDDLELHPNNGWSLLGLELALRAQSDVVTDEVAALAAMRTKMWRRADVNPTSSCYCEPGRLNR
jgi:tetratricopeptide (TPR) repeat protein